MRGRHCGHRTAGPDDLESLARLIGGVDIGRELGHLFLEEPAHQRKAPAIIFDIVIHVFQRGHPKGDGNPIDNLGAGEDRIFVFEALMQPHNGARALQGGHAGEINPDQLGRAAADIHHQKLLGLGRDQRRAGHHGQLRFFLGLDDFQLQPRLALDDRDEFAGIGRAAAGLGRDKAHLGHVMARQLALTNLERANRACHRGARQAARCLKPLAQLDIF